MGRHAVVLGGSMGGLLAARALVGHYERVTVVDRDVFPAGPEHRKGVSQGKHFHALLLRGAEVLDRMFPGLVDDFVADGVPRSNFLREATFVLNGQQMVRTDTGASAIQLTRPLLEGTIRSRLASYPGVKVVDGHEVLDPVFDGDRVTGVRTTAGVLDADLVVDALGRGGRSRKWLADHGFPVPAEDSIDIDTMYVSRLVRPKVPYRDKLVLVGPVPGRPTGFAYAAQEGDRWMLTVVGMAGDHPPTDEEGFLAFLRRSAPPEVFESIAAAEPLTELRPHRFPASLRRRYERVRRFPEGLLVFGDAMCSFNPVYGQGMTVAALEAEALRRCLRAGEHDLARRFFRAAAKIIDPVWQLNAGGDLALPEIPGRRPPVTRAVNRYVARLQRVAGHDPVVAKAFVRTIGLLDPPSSMFAPRVLARVVRG
ncbi:FAD-dependent oxidoreductase [Saccharothrix variisporea]|uniref:2-polyprenyl-6-methoxyphenol hydroxylase-like FAD-dependent oxidoreductase n=1 Tax=Saccharothrix variisporea TaxID=543527 RepID=A0A495XC15_9PSEU|nr:FAD-dependent monooxygenase [Saccharothrix variisporea]RKT69068.1 2-polyprenyl-6-methoxyphenol hydroxylase-like FAD-dependent oxidoreductase [Saccharothrix variisporea]